MVDCYNDFKPHQSSPSDSAFKMLLQAPETHLNCQAIVYFAKINEILYYMFTDFWRCLIS